MPALPVVCDSCHTVFATTAFGGSGQVTMIGCGAGPCPSCGGMGTIPNGTYEFIDNWIAVLRTSGIGAVQLARLISILDAGRANQAEAEDISQAVAKEVPELQELTDSLPKSRKELYQVLALLLALLTFFSQCSTKPTPPITINQFINSMPTAASDSPTTPHRSRPRVGRNDPCPCGSGLKFKRCHGAPGSSRL